VYYANRILVSNCDCLALSYARVRGLVTYTTLDVGQSRNPESQQSENPAIQQSGHLDEEERKRLEHEADMALVRQARGW
jgi:hypothetical protein